MLGGGKAEKAETCLWRGKDPELTKVFNLGGSKNTLLEVDGEAMEGEEVEHKMEV